MAERPKQRLDADAVSRAVRSAPSVGDGGKIVEEVIINFRKRLTEQVKERDAKINERVQERISLLMKRKKEEIALLKKVHVAELVDIKGQVVTFTQMLERDLKEARADRYSMQEELAAEQSRNYILESELEYEKRMAKKRGTVNDPVYRQVMTDNRKKDRIIRLMTNFLRQGDMKRALNVIDNPSLTALDEVDSEIF